MGAWGCPHELAGLCQRVKGLACDPGMKGCILHGRFVWSNEAKNRPGQAYPAAAAEAPTPPAAADPGPPDGRS
jgi:hypothetical protein